MKSKNQDQEDTPDDQKPLTLLNLTGVKTSTNAQNALVEKSLLCIFDADHEGLQNHTESSLELVNPEFELQADLLLTVFPVIVVGKIHTS